VKTSEYRIVLDKVRSLQREQMKGALNMNKEGILKL